MTDLPLIAWDEVPEGHYVWCRNGEHRDWLRVRKHGDEFYTGSGWHRHEGHTFAVAEQQPGEWAAKINAQSMAKFTDELKEQNRRLRDGLAALEQDLRERGYTFEWIADRLAALREGHANG